MEELIPQVGVIMMLLSFYCLLLNDSRKMRLDDVVFSLRSHYICNMIINHLFILNILYYYCHIVNFGFLMLGHMGETHTAGIPVN